MAVVSLALGADSSRAVLRAHQPRAGARSETPSGPLRAGAAKIDITPDAPLSLEGYQEPATRVSEGVHDRLFARAFAFGDGSRRLVIVSCDLGSMILGDYFRHQVLDAVRLRPEELWLCATHTHSGPMLTLHPSYPHNVEYTERLAQPLIGVVGEALRSMRPARLAVGRGRSSVGVSRRRRGADGLMEMAANPDGVADPDVLVLQVAATSGRPMGALFVYACHSRSLTRTNRLISGDVLGIAAQELEAAQPGLIAGAFAGASGDIDPVSVVDGFESKDGQPPETVRLARLLADGVRGAMATARALAPALPLRSSVTRLRLPARHEGRQKAVDIAVCAIGEAAIVGLDCEASVEIGLAIKARSPFPLTAVITNCNGWSGYLPVERQSPAGGYEVDRTGFAPPAAGLLIDAVVQLLETRSS
jgi:hypothetical protein